MIEEVYYSQNIPDKLVERFYSAKNTATSPRELVNNINRVADLIKSAESEGKKFLDLLPVTSAIIRCPLMLPFYYPIQIHHLL